MEPDVKYLRLDDRNFKTVVNLFLDNNAIAYLVGDDVFFGIRNDLKTLHDIQPLQGSYVLLTTDLSCNIIVKDNIIVAMTIVRPVEETE